MRFPLCELYRKRLLIKVNITHQMQNLLGNSVTSVTHMAISPVSVFLDMMGVEGDKSIRFRYYFFCLLHLQ